MLLVSQYSEVAQNYGAQFVEFLRSEGGVTQTGGATTTSVASPIVVANGLSSVDRIASDKAAGNLDVNGFVLSGVYAAAAPNMLPTRYRSATPSVLAEDSLAEYLEDTSQLDQATSDAVEAFLAQPLRGDIYQPSSNIGHPEPGWVGCGNTISTPPLPGLGWAPFTITYCTHASAGGHFQLHYVIADTSATAYAVARDDDGVTNGLADGSTAGNGVPDGVDIAESSLEIAYFVHNTLLGFPAPISGAQTIDVWMVRPPGSDGLTSFVFGHLGPVKGLGTVWMSPQSPYVAEGLAAHELFHVFQYADYRFPYEWDTGTTERQFWYEATANWANHQYVLYRRQFDPSFDNPGPAIPGGPPTAPQWAGNIDAYLATTSDELSNRNDEQRQYGISWLAQYLSEAYPGNPVVRRTWELIGLGQTAKQAISNTVNEQTPSGFSAFLESFARSTYELNGGTDADRVVLERLFAYGMLPQHFPPSFRYTGPDSPFNSHNVGRRERPARNSQTLVQDVVMTLQGDLGEHGIAYIDLNSSLQGANGYITVQVERPDNNIQAQMVLYRMTNETDHELGLTECTAPIDLIFVNGVSTASIGVDSVCAYATVILVRNGPPSPLNAVFGSHITLSALLTASIGLTVPSITEAGLGATAVGGATDSSQGLLTGVRPEEVPWADRAYALAFLGTGRRLRSIVASRRTSNSMLSSWTGEPLWLLL